MRYHHRTGSRGKSLTGERSSPTQGKKDSGTLTPRLSPEDSPFLPQSEPRYEVTIITYNLACLRGAYDREISS